MVEDVGERSFSLDVQALGDGEGFAEAGGEVDEPGPSTMPFVALPKRPMGSG